MIPSVNRPTVVMVVDDDDDVRAVVSLLLETRGYVSVPCRSAQEALEQLRQEQRIDAVVSDIKMPGMTGIDLLDHIHSHRPELPVILMTAYADLDTAVSAIKKGAFDFIIKPYKSEYLLHAIDKAIRYRQLAELEHEYRSILEQFNREIETLISERTMNLMALTVADKVRNPATVISCQCRRLRDNPDMPGKFRAALADIGEEAANLERIVQDFEQVLRNRESLYEYHDLNEVAAEVVTLEEKEAARKGVRISFTGTPSPLRINMQRSLLRTAIFNLLRNATEATEQDGTISVELLHDRDDAVLKVTDTGCGIPKDELGRIFEPFFSTKRRTFGMGLSLVKQIVDEHLGDISVESVMGKGSIFVLRFPLRWKQREAQRTCPVAPSEPGVS